MAALAARGFRALAPDLRGYGDSSAPADPAAYTIFHIVGDVVALLDHLRLTKVFVVGHDWGAQVAWHLCLFRPDRVRAVVALGVPYFGRNPVSMTEVFAALGDGFYITQFQFIAGDKDIGVRSFGIEQYIKSGAFKAIVPDLEVTIIEGHHFLQQEQAERVNSEIISYLINFTSEDASA
ncbi:hypothetical protein U9M48_037662 [Paspalum notatum var. saurae]|uniref:AB hydrolase-1 domain-containing protein n=1 Tax=Paspalum notatum var. saurae TaxID=547442 RepID=A0AAQ3UFH6_PASNO